MEVADGDAVRQPHASLSHIDDGAPIGAVAPVRMSTTRASKSKQASLRIITSDCMNRVASLVLTRQDEIFGSLL